MEDSLKKIREELQIVEKRILEDILFTSVHQMFISLGLGVVCVLLMFVPLTPPYDEQIIIHYQILFSSIALVGACIGFWVFLKVYEKYKKHEKMLKEL